MCFVDFDNIKNATSAMMRWQGHKGLAIDRIAIGDTIVSVNGTRVVSEASGHLLMREASGNVTLRVIKRKRSDADTERDSGSSRST